VIGIIGGGISGLALAHHLARRGRSFILLESSGRVGGAMRSGRVEGRLLDWGPQRARLTGHFAALVDGLGLRDQLITAPPGLPLYIYRDGRLRRVPFSAAQFIASDVLRTRAKLRLLLEPFTAAARPDESVEDCFIRKLGREAYENLAGPLYGGLYASDPGNMIVRLSLAHVLREFAIGRSILTPLLRRRGRVAPPDACSFVDGLETLPRALHARHSAHIRMNTPVHAIERDGDSYVLVTDTGRIEVQHVVITTPAPAAARMLRHIAPDAANAIETLTYNPLTVVHLHSTARLHGLGYQVSLAESLVTRGVTWNDALFDRDGVYTAYLGGARNLWIARESAERAGEIAVEEFRRVTGHDARVLSVAQERMPAWDRSWSALESVQLPKDIHIHASWHDRPGIPGRLALAERLADRLAR